MAKRNPPERVPDVGSLKAIYAGLRRIQPSAEQKQVDSVRFNR
jgi:hypothetical protein